MKRREFIALLSGTVAWPLAARAQQAGKIARVGFLLTTAESGLFAKRVERFRVGLRELGYVEGASIVIDYRWAEDHYDRLPGLAAELVRSNPDVIVTHGTPGALAAKRTTATIPIVVANMGDPIAAGVVASLARPGGNITGLSFFSPQLGAKRIELLKELMPQLTRVAALLNASNPLTGTIVQAMETTARSLKLELHQFPVHSPSEFEKAFGQMAQDGITAVTIDDDPMLITNMDAIAALATKQRMVSIGGESDLLRAGGLMEYGADNLENYHRAAVLVDKILKGTKPADIPFEQATKFQFGLNLKAAKTLGLDVPPIMLVRADEVIE